MTFRNACVAGLSILLPAASLTGAREKPPAGGDDAAIAKAIVYLVGAQNKEGSWGSINNSLPGEVNFWWSPETHRSWRLACTGLACLALMDHAGRLASVAPIERGVDYMIANADVKRCNDWDTDHVWGWIYALEALSRAERFGPLAGRRAAIRPVVDRLIRDLAVYQTPSGGWAYYDFDTPRTRTPVWATTFTTSNAVLALQEAGRSGHAIPPKMIPAAVKAVERGRLPNGGWTYTVEAVNWLQTRWRGELDHFHDIRGSLARVQVAHLALREAGRQIPQDRVQAGLEDFFRHHRFLDVAVSKPIPHEAYYWNSGYFYLYGHAYAARLARGLPDDLRDRFLPLIRKEVLKLQDADGSFTDYPMMGYGRPYGTAFALIALAD